MIFRFDSELSGLRSPGSFRKVGENKGGDVKVINKIQRVGTSIAGTPGLLWWRQIKNPKALCFCGRLDGAEDLVLSSSGFP